MLEKTIIDTSNETLDPYQMQDFKACLNQTFCIRLEGIEPIVLELVDVTELGNALWQGARQPFALHFLGPVSNQYLVQHIYHLENEQLEALDLFIVPLGPEGGRMRYEAIFN
jgi:hypothetical protein